MAGEWEKLNSQEQERRMRVARELDKRAFWKAVYVAAIARGECCDRSKTLADRASFDFDDTFGVIS